MKLLLSSPVALILLLTAPAAAQDLDKEPYSYIWAIHLAEQKMAYWFFWKDEHETMQKRTPGI